MRTIAACFVILLGCGRNLPTEESDPGGAGQGGASSDGGRQGEGGIARPAEGGRDGSGGDPSRGGASGDGGAPVDPIACATCVYEDCPAIATCVQDPVCGPGLGCTVLQCAANGVPPDFGCVSDCFGGDLDAAFGALEALGCVVTTCGADCANLLPVGG